jgi:hypothetical protein
MSRNSTVVIGSSIRQPPFRSFGKGFHHPEYLHRLAVPQFTRIIGTSGNAGATPLAQGLMNL